MEFYYRELGLYPSIKDIVEVMTTLIQESYNHNESCITDEESRRMQKVDVYRATERTHIEFFSTDQEHNFGSIVCKEFRVMFRGKGPHKPELAIDFVRKHSLMLCKDLIG